MAGEPLGLRELAGVLLISGAVLVDSLWDFRQARKAAPYMPRAVVYHAPAGSVRTRSFFEDSW
jgi:hypothetical protein